MNDAANPYRYQPLDSQTRQIRLIRLLPQRQDSWQTIIDCEMVHASLGDYIEYEALSYVWGSENKPYNIRVDGHALPVTMNLFSALVHLREQQTRVLWIDAICINQDSLDERGQQVAMMRHIFGGATQTIVWLGDFGFAALNGSTDFLARMQAEFDAHNEGREYWSKDEIVEQSDVFNSINLMSCPWFGRVWVIQELACSRSVSVAVGKARVSWNCVVWWADRFRTQAQRPGKGIGKLETRSRSAAARVNKIHYYRWRRETAPVALLYLALLSEDFEATDDLDKVYALLGLAYQRDPSRALVVDYATSPMALFQRLAAHNILQYGPLDGSFGEASGDTGPEWMSQNPPPTPFAPFQRTWQLQAPVFSVDTSGAALYHLAGFLIGSTLLLQRRVLVILVPTTHLIVLGTSAEDATKHFLVDGIPLSGDFRRRLDNRIGAFLDLWSLKSPNLRRELWHTFVLPALLNKDILKPDDIRGDQRTLWARLRSCESWHFPNSDGVLWPRDSFDEFDLGLSELLDEDRPRAWENDKLLRHQSYVKHYRQRLDMADNREGLKRSDTDWGVEAAELS